MRKLWTTLAAALMCGACSSDGDEPQPPAPPQQDKPSVTLLTTINGVGDNGYNDCMLDGLFRFQEQTGVVARLLYPTTMAEAEQMYRQWLDANASADSAVLIVGSSSYETMVSRQQVSLKGSGSRLLLLESGAALGGISTARINRYGASYLAGAMLSTAPALILAAMPGVPMLEEAILGFTDGHKAHAAATATGAAAAGVDVKYLANDERGFAMPDSAYHVMARRKKEVEPETTSAIYFYHEAVLPLLGGSSVGAIRAMSDNAFNGGLIIGIDTDRRGLSPHMPFSLVVRIDKVIDSYLGSWRSQQPWPATATLGMKDEMADVVVDPTFKASSLISYFHPLYKDAASVGKLLEQYRAEALAKELGVRN